MPYHHQELNGNPEAAPIQTPRVRGYVDATSTATQAPSFASPENAFIPAPCVHATQSKSEEPLQMLVPQSTGAQQSPLPSSTFATAQHSTTPALLPTQVGQTQDGTRTASVRGRIENPNSTYGTDLKGRPPVSLRMPAGIPISMLEICSYHPSAFLRPQPIGRAVKNEWKAGDIAKAQLYATNSLTKKQTEKVRARLRHQIGKGAKMVFGVADEEESDAGKFLPNAAPFNDLTADGWLYRQSYDAKQSAVTEVDMLLLDIARPIQNWPQGDDRLQMTMCLQYALANPHIPFTTAHWDEIIQSQGFAPPTHLVLDSTHDVAAKQRLDSTVPDPAV